MSVLIKGMEMPKPGCIILVEIDENGNVFATYDGGCTKLVQYKAVPVPPHGNLIEKHDVFKLISAFPEIDKLLPIEFMKALYNLPTIIPAEEEK